MRNLAPNVPTPAEVIALSHLLSEGAKQSARSALGPGVHDVDMTVEIRGVVEVLNERHSPLFHGLVRTRLEFVVCARSSQRAC